MAESVKEKQTSVRNPTAQKEETFIKSFRDDAVLQIEEWKETQAVHPSQDRHGTLEPGPMKTLPPGISKDDRQVLQRKAAQFDCADPEGKYHEDSYSAHDTRNEEARRRVSQFQDLLIRPPHMIKLDEMRKYSRSSLWGQQLDVGARGPNSLENSNTGKISHTKSKSFLDRRKSSVNFAALRKKSTLFNAIAFSRTSIMTERKGKSSVMINQEQAFQVRRESRMDARGTCTYVEVRHVLSNKEGVITDVYNQFKKGWLAIGHKVLPKEFSRFAEKFSICPSAKLGGNLGWISRARLGMAGPF